jgi:hypothetical protein
MRETYQPHHDKVPDLTIFRGQTEDFEAMAQFTFVVTPSGGRFFRGHQEGKAVERIRKTRHALAGNRPALWGNESHAPASAGHRKYQFHPALD